jgi:hypothetical protein
MLGLKFTRVQRRIFTYVKEPGFRLEPQAKIILNQIWLYEPINRFDLCQKLVNVLETRNHVSKVLSYHQRLLTRFGCIRVEEPEAFNDRVWRADEEVLGLMVVASDGGFRIKIPGDSGLIGFFENIAQARSEIRDKYYEKVKQEAKTCPKRTLQVV